MATYTFCRVTFSINVKKTRVPFNFACARARARVYISMCSNKYTPAHADDGIIMKS